jgi:hypothetical protein
MFEPFIFPFQTTHVFFFDEIKKPSWKVVLWKEAQSRKKVANIENDAFLSPLWNPLEGPTM